MNLEVRILKSLKQLKNFDSKNDIVKKRWNKISKIKKTFIIKYLMWNRVHSLRWSVRSDHKVSRTLWSLQSHKVKFTKESVPSYPNGSMLWFHLGW